MSWMPGRDSVVSSRKERIEEAREDCKSGRFWPVPGETELIPLPTAS